MKSTDDLRQLYPAMCDPIRCENGCGVVIELTDGFMSYKRNEHGEPLLVCECCAAEEGHLWEDDELPDEGPVCRRKSKATLR